MVLQVLGKQCWQKDWGLAPILPIELKTPNHQYIQGVNEDLSFKNKTNKKLEKKSTMQTNDKSYIPLSPILPLKLSVKKPKDRKYPKEVLTVGDEIKKIRLDRNLTQKEVSKHLKVNKNFIYELELNKRKLTIFALHKAYLFLGYIPKILKIDENILQGKLFIYRIKKSLTYTKLSIQIDLDKSTLSNFEKGLRVKTEQSIE